MRYLKAFLLGTLAAGVLAGAAIALLSAVAASGAVSDLHLAAWGVVLVQVETAARVTETTIGPGLAVLATLGGVANVLVLAAFARRSRRAKPIA